MSARRQSVLAAVVLSMVLACGRPAVDPAAANPAAGPVNLVVATPAVTASSERPPDGGGAVAAPEPVAEAERDALPRSWSLPVVPGLAFTDALRKARGARDAFGRLAAPPMSAKDTAMKRWFAEAQTQVNQASRMYAAAFHAPDAPREGRIDAIAEAAELDMTMAHSLDDAGLGSMPTAWRSDPNVASTFEDIAIGPTRRWRDEARVLARQCMRTAHDDAVVTEAVHRCAALRTGAAPKSVRAQADAGAAPCACDPGNPLCSASLGGWCALP